MAITRYLVGKTPQQQLFGLDQFTEHWKCDATADVVLTADDVPEMLDAHPDYPFMFITARFCSETGESASMLDLVYTGCIRGGEGPALPSQQAKTSNPIQSQSSTRNGVNATVNFYAKSSVLSFITYLAKGDLGTATDPVGDPTPISLVTGDTAYSPGTAGFDAAVDFYFSITTTDILDSEEIVPGKYWLNVENKNKYYAPFLNACESSGTRSICLYAAGEGYAVDDELTFDYGGGSAQVTVTSVTGGGAITGFSIDSDTIDAPIFLVITATGGSGSGASFQFFGTG